MEAQRAAEKETAARADAERASTETQMITDFLREDVLRSAIQVRGREATVLDVLNAAVAKLDEEEFQSLPLVEASIRNTLSDTYFSLGHYTAAAQHQKRVYRIFAEQFGESDRRTSMTMNWLAVRYYYAGMYREAEPLYEQLVEDASRQDSPVLPQHLLSWKANLATTCTGLGRYEQAGQLLSTVLAAPSWAAPSKRRQFELHLGEIYREQGEYATAEDVLVKALKVCRQGSGPASHSLIVRCMNELAQLYVALNDYEKAEELFKEGIEIGGRELPGADHPFTLRHVNGLGVLRAKQKDYEEAEALFDQALAGRQLKLGENHPETLETINDFGVLRREQKRYEEAEKLLTEALNGRQAKFGEDHPACFESKHELALLHIAREDYEKAEPLLLDAFQGRETKLRPKHPHTLESLKQLVNLYEVWDKPEEAEKWRAELPQKKAAEE